MSNGGKSALDNAAQDANQNMSPSPVGSACSSCGTSPDSPSDQTISPDKKHWIAIELVDAEGRGVADEEFKLTLPDGTTAEGSLDAKGKAKIKGIDAGACQITFPNRDRDSWKPK